MAGAGFDYAGSGFEVAGQRTLRAFVVEVEGNMMLAQANATGRYAGLWERAAEARGVERTTWVRVMSLRDAEARAWDAAAKAWEAVAEAY